MDANFPFKTAQDAESLSGKSQIGFINKAFQKIDESHLFPIRGKFNATRRAIGRLAKVRKEIPMSPLEYSLALENEISKIVNEPKSF